MKHILTIDGLAAGYGDTRVLWDISMAIPAGEITAIVGSNGAGKTTLMRVLCGLLPATQGSVKWENAVDITNVSTLNALTLGLCHVPEGRQLFDGMSVEDNLLMGCFLTAKTTKERSRRLDKVYTYFPRLYERRRQVAGTLSGGEQQMCAVSRGLMSNPTLLMIDELSLGLAPLIVEQLVEVLMALNKEGLTILVVEQDVMTALEMSSCAYVVDRGKTVSSGDSKALINDKSIQEAYLGNLWSD